MKDEVFVYFDMDGVIAVFEVDDPVEATFEKGYFLHRRPEKTLVSALKKLTEAGIHVVVCSAAYDNGYAADEKKQWLKNLGIDNEVIIVPYGMKKSDFVKKPGVHILIDDYTKNLRQWESKKDQGFVGIKYRNGINGNNGTWDGYSIDRLMSEKTIYKTIVAIADHELREVK